MSACFSWALVAFGMDTFEAGKSLLQDTLAFGEEEKAFRGDSRCDETTGGEAGLERIRFVHWLS